LCPGAGALVFNEFAVNVVSKSDQIKANEGSDEGYMRECRCVLTLYPSSESNIESDEHLK
jgi:hypothetical protein